MPQPRLYLDANATTPPLPEVVEAVHGALTSAWGNPASLHAEGRAARRILDAARDEIAALLGVSERWLTFTSGASESINLWLRSMAAQGQSRLGRPGVIVTSPAEHPAVGRTIEALTQAGLWRRHVVAADKLGRIDAAAFREALRLPDVVAAAVIAAHNETGGLQPLPALTEAAAEFEIPLLADGVQWTGRRSVALSDWNLGGWPVSFHKLGGPKGVGVLAAPPGLIGHALITGGPQERRRRAGTENVPGIAGAGEAARLARVELAARNEAWQAWLDRLRSGLPTAWPEALPLDDGGPRLAQTLLVRFPGWRGSDLVQRLDLEGIAAGTGSACSSGAVRSSDAALALGADEIEAAEYVRFSLAPRVGTPDEANRLLNTLAAIRRSGAPAAAKTGASGT